MKKLVFFFSIALLFVACGSNTPSGIAGKFLDCMASKE